MKLRKDNITINIKDEKLILKYKRQGFQEVVDEVYIVEEILEEEINELVDNVQKETLLNMSKKDLEIYAREKFDIELDRRKTKENMIEDFYKH